ncbi:hypothetical protein [Methanosarcina acetivorans]|uniref:hypothetical protein n=1 Tax=Methanosarcina acetivorans TaxID=2214 RepID=UPI00064F2F47|nr:hypothetical protein [Methanosarcina acetivorans]
MIILDGNKRTEDCSKVTVKNKEGPLVCCFQNDTPFFELEPGDRIRITWIHRIDKVELKKVERVL